MASDQTYELQQATNNAASKQAAITEANMVQLQSRAKEGFAVARMAVTPIGHCLSIMFAGVPRMQGGQYYDSSESLVKMGSDFVNKVENGYLGLTQSISERRKARDTVKAYERGEKISRNNAYDKDAAAAVDATIFGGGTARSNFDSYADEYNP